MVLFIIPIITQHKTLLLLIIIIIVMFKLWCAAVKRIISTFTSLRSRWIKWYFNIWAQQWILQRTITPGDYNFISWRLMGLFMLRIVKLPKKWLKSAELLVIPSSNFDIHLRIQPRCSKNIATIWALLSREEALLHRCLESNSNFLYQFCRFAWFIWKKTRNEESTQKLKFSFFLSVSPSII